MTTQTNEQATVEKWSSEADFNKWGDRSLSSTLMDRNDLPARFRDCWDSAVAAVLRVIQHSVANHPSKVFDKTITKEARDIGQWAAATVNSDVLLWSREGLMMSAEQVTKPYLPAGHAGEAVHALVATMGYLGGMSLITDNQGMVAVLHDGLRAVYQMVEDAKLDRQVRADLENCNAQYREENLKVTREVVEVEMLLDGLRIPRKGPDEAVLSLTERIRLLGSQRDNARGTGQGIHTLLNAADIATMDGGRPLTLTERVTLLVELFDRSAWALEHINRIEKLLELLLTPKECEPGIFSIISRLIHDRNEAQQKLAKIQAALVQDDERVEIDPTASSVVEVDPATSI